MAFLEHHFDFLLADLDWVAYDGNDDGDDAENIDDNDDDHHAYDNVAYLEHNFDFFVFDLSWTAHDGDDDNIDDNDDADYDDHDVAYLEHHFDFLVFDLSWTAHHSAACLFPAYSLSIIVISVMMISMLIHSMMMRSMVVMVSDGKGCKGVFFGLSLFGDDHHRIKIPHSTCFLRGSFHRPKVSSLSSSSSS